MSGLPRRAPTEQTVRQPWSSYVYIGMHFITISTHGLRGREYLQACLESLFITLCKAEDILLREQMHKLPYLS